MLTPSSSAAIHTNGADVAELRPSKPEPFVRLGRTLLQSPAWKSLGATERALYLAIATGYDGRNNGRIRFSVRDAKRGLHVGQDKVQNGFETLQRHGFIIPHIDLNGRTWELTEYSWGGEDADRSYLKWGPQ